MTHRNPLLGNRLNGLVLPTLLAALVVPALSGCIIRTQADVDQRQREQQAAVAKLQSEEQEEVPPIEGETGPATPVKARIDVGSKGQELMGFGAAAAWYMERITGQTPAGLYETLFPELGLDILRFRNRFERTDKSDETLKDEVEIFKRATEALGHPPKLFMSSWSPPASLKANGKEKCAGEANCTLKKVDGAFVYDEFADWWRRSLEHYQELGISPDFISIQNEPDFIPQSWEGCKFIEQESDEYPSYGKALDAVHAELQKLDKRPQLWGPEVLGIHYDRMPKYMANLDESKLDVVIHHIYESGSDGIWDWRDPGPDSFIDEMLQVRSVTSKPIIQTEFNTDEDKGIDGGFETAWLIHNTLVIEEGAGFLYWELFWPGQKGLAGMSGRKPKLRDHYYALRHYSLYTDPGYVRVGAKTNLTELVASAFLAPDNSRLTVVLLNTAPEPADVSVLAADFKHSKAKAFRTSFRPGQSKRWEELDMKAGALRMPVRSAVTVVLER